MAKKALQKDLVISDAAFMIMSVLVKPQHGYAVMKTISENDHIDFTLGPATLYTNLNKLLEHDLIEIREDLPQSDDRRKIYALTWRGRAKLRDEVDRRMWMARMADAALKELGDV
ncbi:MAG: helix-turn-helix transcriptional regulator [Anaerolineaceae bacterium]|nr:helix-turn-helix transcriptional regulator [Anaerolineaceae bacterium]